MTKKSWNTWQKRIGETKNVYFTNKYDYWCGNHLLNELSGDKIKKATFKEDSVDLVIARRFRIIDIKTGSYSYKIEDEHLTLNREDIEYVKF